MAKRKRMMRAKEGGKLFQSASDRIRAKEALRESEERFRIAFQSSPLGIIMTRLADNHMVDVNDALLRMWGYTREEVIGRTAEDLNVWVNPEDRRKMIQSLREKNPIQMFESQFRRKSGDLAWGLLSATLVDIGEQPHLMVQVQDVTERKRTEEKLRIANETVRTLVTASPSAIIAVDLEGRATAWNRAAERIFGWTAHEVIGKPLPMTPPEIAEEVKALRQRALRGETVTGYEGKRLRKDGSLVDVSVGVGPAHDQSGRVVGTIGVMTDITERKRAEEKLNRTTAQLNTLVQSSPAAIFGIDKERRVTTWSPAAERMYGWSAQEVMGKPIPTIPEDRREEYEVLLQRSLRGEPLVDYETRRLRKDGSLVDVSLSTAPLRNAEGEIVGTMGVHVDISARKRAEEKLLASANMLRKTLFSTIDVICKIVEARDPYTSGHEERVGALAMAIAHEMGLSEDRIEGVRVAAAIHDIGKLQVPIEILSRPGKLSDAEFAIIKTHPQVGYDILSGFEFPWPIATIARQHHERMDGSGYPNALRGDDILLEARVLTVADVVESMSSHRPYRPAHTLEEALEEMEQHRGTKYDPQVVDVCLKLFREKGYKLE